MPVVQVDGHTIHNGAPGPTAIRLREIYLDFAKKGGALAEPAAVPHRAVMLALVASIHVLNTALHRAKTWMVGTSPTMTVRC